METFCKSLHSPSGNRGPSFLVDAIENENECRQRDRRSGDLDTGDFGHIWSFCGRGYHGDLDTAPLDHYGERMSTIVDRLGGISDVVSILGCDFHGEKYFERHHSWRWRIFHYVTKFTLPLLPTATHFWWVTNPGFDAINLNFVFFKGKIVGEVETHPFPSVD